MLVYALPGSSRPLGAMNPEAPEVVERSPLGQALGHERMVFNLLEAMKAFEKREKTA